LFEDFVFPFVAIVGQEELKLALILNAINPAIGGVLISGEKGSGKSTAVRALADLLPEVEVVADCPFDCNPHDPSAMCEECRKRYESGDKLPVVKRKMKVVTLPLGATEDRLVGSLDIERAIKEGVKALEPGILAEANQNILYVDEVNLLPDHLVDDLLDAAAMGVNIVEREGISVSHPSKFILVGTMNPEEGSLRPQLLDRFALHVKIESIKDIHERVEIIKRNLEFKENPKEFRKKWEPFQKELREKIIRAREILPKVKISEWLMYVAAKISLTLNVDGHRPDIVICEAAKAIAAFHERTEVIPEDIRIAARLALSHRTRNKGREEPATPREIDEAFKNALQTVKKEIKTEIKPIEEIKGKTKSKKVNPKKLKNNETKKKKRFILMEGKSEKKGKPFSLKSKKGPIKDDVINEIVYSKYRKKPFSKVKSHLIKIVDFIKIKRGKKKKTKGIEILPLTIYSRSYLDSSLFDGSLPLPEKIKGFFRKIVRIKPSKQDVQLTRKAVGKRVLTLTTRHKGKCISYTVPRQLDHVDIHWPATIRSAAVTQGILMKNSSHGQLAIKVLPRDIREKVRVYKAPLSLILVLDMSGSMAAWQDAVGNAVISLYGEAYRHRDKVGLIVFRGDSAYVLQRPTSNFRKIIDLIMRLKASGYTPLALGMLRALEVAKEEKIRDREVIPAIIVISDAAANVPLRKLRWGKSVTALKDAIEVAKIIRREQIPFILINPVAGGGIFKNISSMFAWKIVQAANGTYFECDINERTLVNVRTSILNMLDKGL